MKRHDMQVDLPQMMAAREARVKRQEELLRQFGVPLIILTLNIPGPVKTNALIEDAFSLADQMLQNCLAAHRIHVLHHETVFLSTGPEGFVCVSADAQKVKGLCIALEERDALGRLLDLDVLDQDGRKLARGSQNERSCLVCGAPGRACAAGRLHPANEVFDKAMAIIKEVLNNNRDDEIARLAVQALLFELAVTPKPGLVDRFNNGAHHDMDFYTFLSSAPSLFPYFKACAQLGREYGATPACFARLRTEGVLAEGTMLRATKGINTHKGAIFTLGILSACAGHLLAQESAITAAGISKAARELTAQALEAERASLTAPVTFGEQLMSGSLSGARAEAAGGYPSVVDIGLPALRSFLLKGKSLDDAGVCALLSIMGRCQDTVLLRRGKDEDMGAVINKVRQTVEKGCPGVEILALDALFIQKNLSPGGSADLLAASFFLHFLTE